MGGVISGLVVFAVVIAVGWLLVRTGGVPAGSDTVLTRVCFYAATPALLVTTVGKADLATLASPETVAGLAAETLGVLTAWCVHRYVLRRDVAESVIGALAGGYVNAANLGIPVLILLLGDATAIAPIVLLQMLVLAPVAFAILDRVTYQGPSSRLATLTAPLRNPLIIGVAVGLVVNALGIDLTAPLGGLIARSLDELGPLAVTVMMLSLGMSLAASSPKVTRRLTITEPRRLPSAPRERPRGAGAAGAGRAAASDDLEADGAPSALPVDVTAEGALEDRSERGAVLWVSVAWKLVVVPLMALGFGAALDLRGGDLLAPVTTASLPCAQNVFMYATRYGAAKPLARDCVLITTAGFVPVVLLASALLH